MMRHETERLWALAARELPLEDQRYVELHLQDCPECRDALEAVSIAQRAVDTARRSSPSIDWVSTDSKVGTLVEKRLRAAARPRWLPAMLGTGLVAVAAVALVLVSLPVEVAPPPEPPMVELREPLPIRVEAARGLTRVAASNEPVSVGDLLRSGDVLRTGVAGKAFVHLPDSSHLRVAAGTQVALTRAEADDVALTLSRGRVAIRASHEARRGFVVHAGDVSVHVVGTVFLVENDRDGVEVAVSEGAVRVATGDLKETLVSAGQRLSIDPKGRTRVLPMSPAAERELSEVQGVAEAVASAEQQQIAVPSKGGARPQSLPRLSSEEAKARQVEALPATDPVEPAKQEVVVRGDGPGSVFPSLAGGSTRGVPAPRESSELPPPTKPEGPVTEEADWVAMPKAVVPPTLVVPALEQPKPAPVEAPRPAATHSGPKSLEQVFLEKAQVAIEKGGCERFMPGLEDMVLESSSSAELARVMRARCFDAQLRPRQAMSEYSKYLEAHPHGRFADEARSALGH